MIRLEADDEVVEQLDRERTTLPTDIEQDSMVDVMSKMVTWKLSR